MNSSHCTHDKEYEASQPADQDFKSLAENLPDAIARYNRHGCLLYVNPAFVRLTGQDSRSILGKSLGDLTYFPASIAQDYIDMLAGIMETGTAADFKLAWHKAGSKDDICLHVRAVPERDGHAQVISILTIASDITLLQETESRLKESESIARLGHWQWGYQRQQALVSEGLRQLLHLPGSFTPSWQNLLELIAKEDQERVRSAIRGAQARQARELTLEFRAHAGDRILDAHSILRFDYDDAGKPTRSLGTVQDISELRRYQRQLQKLAFYDALTELPNRALFNDRIMQALRNAGRHQHLTGLLLLDLDNFKTINDAFGHGIGDQLLCQVARRLQQSSGACGTVARLGGDEFAIVLPELARASDLEQLGEKLLDALSAPYWLNGQELFISASIGIAHYPQDGDNVADLLQFADLAMYQAKALGRNNFQFYAPAMLSRASERLALAADLRYAVSHGELVLFYQPQVDISSSAVIGAEALLRWQHPTKGLLTPDIFISIAEETGQIVPIGEWVLETACQAACAWNRGRQPGDIFKVAVNLSARQFKQNDLVASVKRILKETGCAAAWLELEITESLLLDDSLDVRYILDELCALGLALAIDDFGTGYSALGYLKRFPVHAIKVDRSFINDIISNDDSAALVKAIIFMAHSLRLEVVAEGVETPSQQAFLAEHRCCYGQGYLFGKPMSQDALEQIIALAPG